MPRCRSRRNKLPETLPLFPEPEPETKLILARRLRALAAQNIYMGTSSWKYPGWLGAVYSPQRYSSQKRFEEECLVEYAEAFPIVCGDFAFYQFPSPQFWQKLFGKVPQAFLFAFKAPEEITRPRFPSHARYGNRSGLTNLSFLDAEILKTQFLELLRPYAGRIPLIIFEFGAIPQSVFASAAEFVAALNPFLDACHRHSASRSKLETLNSWRKLILKRYGTMASRTFSTPGPRCLRWTNRSTARTPSQPTSQ